MSPYGAMGNNPIMYVDPNGEELVSAIIIGAAIGAAIGGASVAIANPKADFGDILSGAGIGAITGAAGGAIGASGLNAVLQIGTNSALQGGLAYAQGGDFWSSLATGALGGYLSQFGGGGFLENVAWGAGGGAITGAFGATLTGNDLGQGILYGASGGAVTAGIFSTIESVRNAADGYGFGTNDGRFNKLVRESVSGSVVDPVRAQRALDFWTTRFGGPSMAFTASGSSTTDLYGNISISGIEFLNGIRDVRNTIAHEHGHYYKDIAWRNNVPGGVSQMSWNDNSSAYGGDGRIGYHYGIKNAGRYHVGLRASSYSPTNSFVNSAWNNHGIFKWFHLLPRRF